MSIKIMDVKVSPTNYNWQNVKELGDWNTFKNTNKDWEQPIQTSIVGQPISIEVEVEENNWKGVRNLFTSWQDIKDSFTSWLGLKNW